MLKLEIWLGKEKLPLQILISTLNMDDLCIKVTGAVKVKNSGLFPHDLHLHNSVCIHSYKANFSDHVVKTKCRQIHWYWIILWITHKLVLKHLNYSQRSSTIPKLAWVSWHFHASLGCLFRLIATQAVQVSSWPAGCGLLTALHVDSEISSCLSQFDSDNPQAVIDTVVEAKAKDDIDSTNLFLLPVGTFSLIGFLTNFGSCRFLAGVIFNNKASNQYSSLLSETNTTIFIALQWQWLQLQVHTWRVQQLGWVNYKSDCPCNHCLWKRRVMLYFFMVFGEVQHLHVFWFLFQRGNYLFEGGKHANKDKPPKISMEALKRTNQSVYASGDVTGGNRDWIHVFARLGFYVD